MCMYVFVLWLSVHLLDDARELALAIEAQSREETLPSTLQDVGVSVNRSQASLQSQNTDRIIETGGSVLFHNNIVSQ